MEKVLIIENASTLPTQMKFAVESLKKDHQVEVITNCANKIGEIRDAFEKGVDILFFETTFLDKGQSQSMIIVLSQTPSMEVWISHHDLKESLIDYIFEDDSQIWAIKQHKIFEVYSGSVSHRLDDKDFEWKKAIDFNEEISRHQSVIDSLEIKKQEQLKNLTGRKVVVCDLHAFGKQWSNLKKGDVVDELVRPDNDPQPSRGIWVKGLTEPVKLINESGFSEYEYFGELSLEQLTEIFLQVAHQVNPTERDFRFVKSVLNDDLSPLEMAQTVLDEYGVALRFNRSFLANTVKLLK